MNNNLRKEASKTENDDEFGKDFFKLMNNSCYGQLMMNELKFKFEKWNIAEIGASQSKTNSILYLEKDGHLKSNITSKCISGCCIDDDNPKRDKEKDRKEGGVFYMKLDKDGKIVYAENGDMEYTIEDAIAVVRHMDMIKCVKDGKGSGKNIHRLVTKQYTKKTFSIADNKRYQTEDFHSLAYGHKDDTELISMNEVKKGRRKL